MILNGGMLGNIMNMTLDDLMRENQINEEASSDSDMIVVNIFGTIKLSDIVNSFVSNNSHHFIKHK